MKKVNVLALSMLIVPLLSCSNEENKSEERKLLCNMLDKQYGIVLTDSPSETEKYVANELKETYYRCTNVELPIYFDSTLPSETNFISLGDTSSYLSTSSSKNIDLSIEALNEDGFYIFTNSNNIYINSYNDRGLMYGVYEFLEDTLGVKYLSYDYTYYPTLTNNVGLYSYDKAYVPAFAQRAYLNTPVFENDFSYVGHMRFNTDYAVMPSNMGGSSLWHKFPVPGHTVGSIIPYKDYLSGGVDENGNPLIQEEYREVFQHRYIGDEVVTNFYLGELDLCYTNGIDYNQDSDKSTLHLMVESLKKILDEDRECEYLHIGQADVAYSCPCSNCSKMASKYRSSGVMIRFVNEVEKQVNSYLGETQDGREVTFSMFAYSYNVKPPLNEDGDPIDESVIPNKKVTIKYAPIQADYVFSLDDPRQNDSTRNQLKQWSTLGCDFMSWTYSEIYTNFFYYYPHYTSLSSLLKELYNAKVTYEFDQSLYNENAVYSQHLDAYIFSKLCWDLDANVNEIAEEFCKYYFGEAAYKGVLSFHELMNNHYLNLNNKGIRLSSDGSFVTSANFPIQLMEKACGYFTDAIAKTSSSSISKDDKDIYIAHLEKAYLTPLYMKLKFYPFYDGVSDEANSKLANEFFALTDKYSVNKYGENALLTIASLKKEYGI